MHNPLLDKVRKLLALAGSSNVHEAALAAAKAQELIDRHRLEDLLRAEAHADTEPLEDGRADPLETSKRLRRWKTVLAAILADANGCISYTLPVGAKTAICLAGRPADREAARALWTWLLPRIEWLSATHGAGQSKRWHDDFRVGAAQAVAEQLRAPRPVPSAQDAAALVRLEPILVARERALADFAEQRLGLKPGRALRVLPSAYAAGKAAGASLAAQAPRS